MYLHKQSVSSGPTSICSCVCVWVCVCALVRVCKKEHWVFSGHPSLALVFCTCVCVVVCVSARLSSLALVCCPCVCVCVCVYRGGVVDETLLEVAQNEESNQERDQRD